jgi:hypothetical protein
VELDGAPIVAGTKRWVVVGPHHVEVGLEGGLRSYPIRIDPAGTIEVRATPNAVATPLPIHPTDALPRSDARDDNGVARGDRGGLSSAWFWGGLAVTGALGGITIASGVDTAHKHDAFTTNQSPTAGMADDGRAAQLRTNILLAATSASAVATALIGLVFVRWRDLESAIVGAPPATYRVSPAGAGLSFAAGY